MGRVYSGTVDPREYTSRAWVYLFGLVDKDRVKRQIIDAASPAVEASWQGALALASGGAPRPCTTAGARRHRRQPTVDASAALPPTVPGLWRREAVTE